MPSALVEQELTILEELEDQRRCWSRFHPSGKYGHEDSDLVWVQFFCRCRSEGITIRCQAWLNGVSRREAWDCAQCGANQIKSDDWFVIIGPVE